MHVTQKAIADQLGVSRQLVTHALNGVGTISEEKRREVLEAAERMGYRRNELARAVATGKSRILGILTNNPITESMARTIAGALEEAAEQGYSTKVMFLPWEADEAEAQRNFAALFQLAIGRRVGGWPVGSSYRNFARRNGKGRAARRFCQQLAARRRFGRLHRRPRRLAFGGSTSVRFRAPPHRSSGRATHVQAGLPPSRTGAGSFARIRFAR